MRRRAIRVYDNLASPVQLCQVSDYRGIWLKPYGYEDASCWQLYPLLPGHLSDGYTRGGIIARKLNNSIALVFVKVFKYADALYYYGVGSKHRS